MPRLSLDIDEARLRFATEILVRTTDLNVANHLANDSVATILSEARSRFFADVGITEVPSMEAGSPDGEAVGVLVTDLAIVYQGEGRRWDELMIKIGLADPNKYGGDVVFVVTRKADGAPIAKAKTGFVFFDYRTHTVAAIPEAMQALFDA